MKIVIPISECDIQMFQDLALKGVGHEFNWCFEADNGKTVEVEFVQDLGEDDEREED